MFCLDLTPYVYDRNNENGRAVSIGWLANGHPFATGDTPDGFLALLRKIPVTNHYRGWHTCEFCGGETPRLNERCGNGDLRVRGTDGVVYVAPVLITHYVERHRYLPPAVFVEAVMASERIPEPQSSPR